MSEQMKPCPNPACGNKYPDLVLQDGMYAWVVCYKCDLQGPEIECKDEDTIEVLAYKAIAAWDALPRALVWTTEPPKVEGWYFVRSICPVSGIAGPAVIELRVSGQDAVREEACTEWAGPIPEPQEPTP